MKWRNIPHDTLPVLIERLYRRYERNKYYVVCGKRQIYDALPGEEPIGVQLSTYDGKRGSVLVIEEFVHRETGGALVVEESRLRAQNIAYRCMDAYERVSARAKKRAR